MKKINIEDYCAKDPVTGNESDYSVRGSLVAILFSKPLTGEELLKRDDLGRKIINMPGTILLLEDAEYQTLLSAYNVCNGFGVADVEMVKRIINAEDAKIGLVE